MDGTVGGADDEVVDQRAVAADGLRADAAVDAALDVIHPQLRHVTAALPHERADAGRVRDLASAPSSRSGRRPATCRARRGSGRGRGGGRCRAGRRRGRRRTAPSARAEPRRPGCGSGACRGTAGPGRGPGRCWRGPGRRARAAVAGRRRGRGRCAGPDRRLPATASRSAQGPAQTTSRAVSVSPPDVAIAVRPPGASAKPRTCAAEVDRAAGGLADLRRRRVATAAKSTTPVAGECRASIPAACGSSSRSRSGPIRSSPGTPLAVPRRSSSSSRGSSSGLRRDDHLAVPPSLDPALVAVVVQRRRALDAEPRLQRAGRVVDAGVDDAARVAALVGGGRRPRAPARRRSRPGDATAAPAPSPARRCRRRRP